MDITNQNGFTVDPMTPTGAPAALSRSTNTLPTRPPSPNLLKKAGTFGPVHLASPAVKITSLSLIGFGVASACLCTGIGIPVGLTLLSAGIFWLGVSTACSVNNALTSREHYQDTDFNMVTFNVGNTYADFIHTCKHHEISPTLELYEASKLKTASYFSQLAAHRKLDVLMLQEVQGAGLILDALEQQGFSVHRAHKRNDDCAIVLNSERFKVLAGYYQEKVRHDVPIVIAKDKKTNQIFMFVSVHFEGMNLVNLDLGKDGAVDGDNCASALVTLMDDIAKRHNATIRLIGADVNTSPDIFDSRFRTLKRAGFEAHISQQTTAVNHTRGQESLVERRLDHTFSKTDYQRRSWLEWLAGVRQKGSRLHASHRVLAPPIQDDGMPLQSDHLPVGTNFSFIGYKP